MLKPGQFYPFKIKAIKRKINLPRVANSFKCSKVTDAYFASAANRSNITVSYQVHT